MGIDGTKTKVWTRAWLFSGERKASALAVAVYCNDVKPITDRPDLAGHLYLALAGV